MYMIAAPPIEITCLVLDVAYTIGKVRFTHRIALPSNETKRAFNSMTKEVNVTISSHYFLLVYIIY